MSSPQEIVDTGLSGSALANALWGTFQEIYSKSPEEAQRFLHEKVTSTVWHGTRRKETDEELLKNGFCSYTQDQAMDWVQEASRLICEKKYKGKPGPIVCKRMDRRQAGILYNIRGPGRGQFSVSGIKEASCGDKSRSLMGGWADRNPEFMYDLCYQNGLTEKETAEILGEMFGKPRRVELKVKIKVQDHFDPQDIHLEQRCFKPEEIVKIEACSPKKAEET